MLTHLQIRDFAIIDAVELELRPGLTVLTGETGAGKSILVDALQLLAGGRAGAEVVRHGAERAEVSGTFDLARAPRELKPWLEEQSVKVTAKLFRIRASRSFCSAPPASLDDPGDEELQDFAQFRHVRLAARTVAASVSPSGKEPEWLDASSCK